VAVYESLVEGSSQSPCIQFLKDADHPMIHVFLGYDIICILHVHILHPETHHSVLLHHNKPPRDIRFLNLIHCNVNHNVSNKVKF